MPRNTTNGNLNRSIKGKIAAVLIISLAVLVAVLTGLGKWRENDHLQQQEKDTQALAKRLNDFIKNIKGTSDYISQNRYVRKRLSENPNLSNTDKDTRDISVTLYSIKLVSNASIAYVMNTGGLVIASTSYAEGRTLTGNRYEFRPYFKEAIAGKNIIYAAVGVTTQQRGLYFSSPVFRPGLDKPIGVVVLKMGLETIDRIINNYQGTAGIISPDGIVFSVSEPSWLFKAALPMDKKRRAQLIKSRQFADQPLQPLPFTLAHDTFRQNSNTYGIIKKDIEIQGWSVFTTARFKSSYPFQLALLIFIVIAFVTFLIILNLLNNRQKTLLEEDKKQAEDEILNQYNFLKSVLDSLAYPFFIVNLDDYSIALANKASGFSNLEGKQTCYQASHGLIQPCEKKDSPCSAQELRKNGKPVVIEESFEENGLKKYVEVHAHPIFDSNGKPVQMIKYIVDITHRKKMEDELMKRRQIESIGILAGGIAHDFNNLLSVIIGNITLVKDELLEGESHYLYLANAEKAVIKAADLAKKLTTFSRGGWLERESMEISQVVQQAIADMPTEYETEYNIHLEDDLQPVYGDKRQMVQVFRNIFQNAVEAESTTITVTGSNVENSSREMAEIGDPEELKHVKYIHIAIKDIGKGITPKDLGKIFHPYFSTKPKGEQKGVGLGLTVCYSIVNKHKGYIQAKSGEGKGTTINIYLPANTGEEKNN